MALAAGPDARRALAQAWRLLRSALSTLRLDLSSYAALKRSAMDSCGAALPATSRSPAGRHRHQACLRLHAERAVACTAHGASRPRGGLHSGQCPAGRQCSMCGPAWLGPLRLSDHFAVTQLRPSKLGPTCSSWRCLSELHVPEVCYDIEQRLVSCRPWLAQGVCCHLHQTGESHVTQPGRLISCLQPASCSCAAG